MLLFFIIFFTAAIVVDCLILVFLILMQLPKKEAGAGLAFGGGATDALFGAGSGNVLTKTTKYAAGIFFALAILLSVLESWRAHQPGSDFMQKLQQAQQPTITAPPAPQPASTTPAAAPNTTTQATTNGPLIIPLENAPAATNSAPATPAP
jgi:preprotein translocase subunit SecG